MNDAYYIAATGMRAQQISMDAIANNVANMNTVGFKRSVVSFSDLVQRDVSQTDATTGAAPAGAPQSAIPLRSYGGVGIAGMTRQFDTGDLKQTGAPLDLAIQGDGFLEVTLPDGSRAYTRGGSLKVGLDGQLTTQAGFPIRPGIAIPSGAQGISIGADGRLQLTVSGQANRIEAGQIDLVRFANPSRLAVLGDNLYAVTPASGEAIAGRAGENGMGSLSQGMLELSNVKMVDEMVNMLVAQRAYEVSLKVVQAADEMSGMVNNMRK